MSVLLVSPPQWTLQMPHLGVAALSGYLKQQAVPVRVWDLNLDAFEWLVSRDHLEDCLERAERRLRELDGASALSVDEQHEYLSLVWPCKTGRAVIDRVPDAVDTFRDNERFYDPAALGDAGLVVQAALDLASAPCFPTAIRLDDLKLGYEPGSSRQLLAAAHDEQQNPYLSYFRDVVLPRLAEDPPQILGLSIMVSTQLIPAFTLARLVRERLPDVHVVAGGATITLLRDAIVKIPDLFDAFHSFILFEGEKALVQLWRHISGEIPADAVSNRLYRTDLGEVRATAEDTKMQLGALPAPDFGDLDLDRYLAPEPTVPFELSRGCYWGKCKFCGHPGLVSARHGDFHRASIEASLTRLNAVRKQTGARAVYLVDPAVPPAMLKALTRVLGEDPRNDLIFSCVTRMEPPFEDPEFCRDLAAAGCRKLWLGHETVSDRVLDLMGKWPASFASHRERTLTVMRNLSRAGIGVHLFAMLGYPSETEEEMRENHAFLQSLCQDFRKDLLTFSVGECVVPTTSPLWYEREELGIEPVDRGAELDMPLQLGFRDEGGVPRKVVRAHLKHIREDLARHLAGSVGQRCSIPNEINATFYHPLYIDASRRQSVSWAPPTAPMADGNSWAAEGPPPRLGRDIEAVALAFPLSSMLKLAVETQERVAESGYLLSSSFWLNPEYQGKLDFERPGAPLEPAEEMVLVRYDGLFSILSRPERTLVEWLCWAEQQRNDGTENPTLGDLLDRYRVDLRRKVGELLEHMCANGLLEAPRLEWKSAA